MENHLKRVSNGSPLLFLAAFAAGAVAFRLRCWSFSHQVHVPIELVMIHSVPSQVISSIEY
jgi:hypothetical protein